MEKGGIKKKYNLDDAVFEVLLKIQEAITNKTPIEIFRKKYKVK